MSKTWRQNMDMHIKHVFYNSTALKPGGKGMGWLKKIIFINLADVYKWRIQAIYHKQAITCEVQAIQHFILPTRNTECFFYKTVINLINALKHNYNHWDVKYVFPHPLQNLNVEYYRITKLIFLIYQLTNSVVIMVQFGLLCQKA